MSRPTQSRVDPWLAAILTLGLGARLLFFTAPYADAHRWRQIENLAIAWNFAHGSLNPFYPEAIWGGLTQAYVEMEFPLVPYVLALSWRAFGEHDAFGRLIGIASSLVLIGAIYALGRDLFSRAAARGAALLLALSPTAVFFGRVPMTDTPMIACSTLAVLGYLRYFDTGSRAWAIGGAAAAAGAWLLKVPALLILGPLVAIAWQARGWRLITDRLFVGGLALAFVIAGAWYLHALRLYEQTGWTVGIWHEAGQHPSSIAAASGGTSSTFSLWSSRELLTSRDFYRRLFDRVWYLHLTPLGVAGVLFGLVSAVQRRRGWIVLAWFAAACSFILVVGFGNYYHEYYQLPLLPPAALLFGLGTAWFFTSRGEDNTRRETAFDAIARPIVILLLAGASFYYSGVIRNFFRPETWDRVSTAAGAIMGNHIPPGDGVIVLEYEQGTNSPVLLYFMKHRGWSFDFNTISPEVIEHLKQQGATHFATTAFLTLEEKRSDVVAHLRRYREIPLGERAPEGARLFELQ